MQTPSARGLLKLALPIAAGMLSLSLLSLIETIILGHYDQVALAASAAANYVFFIFLSAFAGFAIAAQTQVARHIETNKRLAHRFVQISTIQIVSCALFLITTVHFFKTQIISIQVNDPTLIKAGADYLQIKSWSVLPIAFLMALRGYWHGANKPKTFLLCLLSSHISSAVFCYLLVNGKAGFPELGLNGAAIANLISISVGTCVLILLSRHVFKKASDSQTLNSSDFKLGWQLAWPTSLQQATFAVGTAAYMAIIGRLGITELAAAHLLITLSLVLILPVIGIGMAATTFISQSFSRFQESKSEAGISQQWYKLAITLACSIVFIIGISMLLLPEKILFILTDEVDVVEAAYWSLLILAPSLLFEAFAITTKQSLYAIRQNKAVMKVLVITQWGLLLPSMLLIHLSGHGSLEIYIVMHAAQRAINSIWLYRTWKREHKRQLPNFDPSLSDIHKTN